MARHIEQPASLHSNPLFIKILSNSSSSACFLIIPEPGTTKASLILLAIFLFFKMLAAIRKSSIRELVHDPIKILSILISDIFVLALRCI